jgi:general secretion pathway protein C
MSSLPLIAVAVLAQAAGTHAAAPSTRDQSAHATDAHVGNASAHVSAKEIARGIHCNAPGDCVVKRALVDRLLGDSDTLNGAARLVPAVVDGQPAGFKLEAVRPRSWLDRLGVHDGDTLQKVNGMDVTTPAQALLAYTVLRNETRFAVSIVRGGEPMTLHFEIR